MQFRGAVGFAINQRRRFGFDGASGAGAASLAAALRLRDQLRGRKVVGIVSGGNLPLARFADLLT